MVLMPLHVIALLFTAIGVSAQFEVLTPAELARQTFPLTALSTLFGRPPGYAGLFNLTFVPANLCDDE